MDELIFLVEEDPDGGFTAKALGENIFTQGNTMKELKEMIKDAIECHFDSPEQMPKKIGRASCRERVLMPV